MNDGRELIETRVKHSGCPETLKHFHTVKMAGYISLFLCLS